MGSDSFNWPFILVILVILHRVNSVSAVCELSFKDSGKLYNYSLASPLAKFPHGVLGEDGYFLSLSLFSVIILVLGLGSFCFPRNKVSIEEIGALCIFIGLSFFSLGDDSFRAYRKLLALSYEQMLSVKE